MAWKFEEDFNWWVQDSSPDFWEILCWRYEEYNALRLQKIWKPIAYYVFCPTASQLLMQMSDARHFCHFGQYGCLLFRENGEKILLKWLSWCWVIAFLQFSSRYDTFWMYSCFSDKKLLFICMTKAVLHAGVLIDQGSSMDGSVVWNRLCIIVEHKRTHPSP